MPVLSDRWLSVLRIVGVCAAGIACAGLLMLHPGIMMVGLILAVLCAYIVVMQASLRHARLRRAVAGVCRSCGYEHGLMPEPDPSKSLARCPECGSPIA